MERVVVVCPTYNRAHALEQTLGSLVAQTYPYWRCLLLDDGSTDGTREIAERFAAADKRIEYTRYEENRGGVAMNELGMSRAIDEGDIWVRLGSDDWFLPLKLELDVRALQENESCYGPYQNYPESFWGELNVPANPRAALLRGEFAVSWANIAMRTSVLKKVRDRHGTFCDPRLRNMEDYLFNVRAARFTGFAWRAASTDGTQVVVGATSAEEIGFAYAPDARYRIGWDGASNSPTLRDYLTSDARFTEVIRGEDAAKNFEVATVPPPVQRVFPRTVSA